MQSLLKLDIFRKLPKDLSEPTFCGALCKLTFFCETLSVSIVCTIVMVVLGTSEIRNYFQHQTSSSLFISTSHSSDTFHANLDITFPYIPCDIIGLSLRDSLNNHVSDYYGELHKHRLDE